MLTRDEENAINDHLIFPRWQAPPNVKACMTTRKGGVSRGCWESFNLSTTIGDDKKSVLRNRKLLYQRLSLTRPPLWPTQTHGNHVVAVETMLDGEEADGVVSFTADFVCAILTADCLPVVLCTHNGQCVGVAHVGWKGLASGILEATVNAMREKGNIMAWLGACIGPLSYQVGDDVRDSITSMHPFVADCFVPDTNGRWRADLARIARVLLLRLDVFPVTGGWFCTYLESLRFFSYRRDQQRTGRMGTLVWISTKDGQ